MRRPHLASLAPVALALLLGACGGGGGDAAGTATAGGTVQADTQTSSSAAYDCGLANFQAELLQRVNALRAAGASCGTHGSFAPTVALAWNDKLTQAGLGHSTDMATRNFFDHTNPDGVTFDARITAAGYAWSTAAENIAAGQATVQAVMDAWRNSDGHCANLMNPNLRDIGVACVPGKASSSYRIYWTMDLGTAR